MSPLDSTTDTPVILTEQFADKISAALADVIINKCGLIFKNSAGVNNTDNCESEQQENNIIIKLLNKIISILMK